MGDQHSSSFRLGTKLEELQFSLRKKKEKKKKLRETSALVQIKHFIVVPSVFILYKTISAFQNEKSF